MAGRPLADPPGLFEQREVIREHYRLAEEIYGPDRACHVMCKFGIKYSRLHPREGSPRRVCSGASPGTMAASAGAVVCGGFARCASHSGDAGRCGRPLAEPEIRISKSETNRKPKIRRFKTSGVLDFGPLVLDLFWISSFERRSPRGPFCRSARWVIMSCGGPHGNQAG